MNEHAEQPEGIIAKPKSMGRAQQRAQRMVRIYGRERIKADQSFRTTDGSQYGVTKAGNFVRLDKDPRSAKERKRARREARAK